MTVEVSQVEVVEARLSHAYTEVASHVHNMYGLMSGIKFQLLQAVGEKYLSPLMD